MATETDWIFDGCGRFSEFREEVGTGTDGSLSYQAIQRRTVYQFRRHKYLSQDGGVELLDEGSLGDESNGASIYGKQGSVTINATIAFGVSENSSNWICMSDDIETTEVGLHAWRRVQVWEKRDKWEDYDLPAAS